MGQCGCHNYHAVDMLSTCSPPLSFCADDCVDTSCRTQIKMEDKDEEVNGSGAAPLFLKVGENMERSYREESCDNCLDEVTVTSSDVDDVAEVTGSSSDVDDAGESCLPLVVKMEEGSYQDSSLNSSFKEDPEVGDGTESDKDMGRVKTDPVLDSSELVPSSPSEQEAEYEAGEVPNDSLSDSDKMASEPIANGKMQQCPHCEYRSRKSFNVKSHIMAKHTKQKPHECPYCNYRATQAGHLKVHIMYKHTNEKPHHCPQCDFRATRYEQVRCHIMAKHTNEKPHPCPYCDYRATESGTLKSHVMAKHTNEKPHQCPHCDYRAIRSSGIRKHIMNKHTFEKPHQCPFCGYRARQFSQLRSHIVFKHTNEAPYQCPHCDYRATQSGHLRRHIMRKHRLELIETGLSVDDSH